MSRSVQGGSPLAPLWIALVVAALLAGVAAATGGPGRLAGSASGLLLVALLAVALARARRRERRARRLAVVGRALASGRRVRSAGETADDDLGRLGRALDRLAERFAAEGSRARVLEGGLHDPLTGLPGRRLLQELLAKQLAQGRRSRELVGLILCDLDDLKAINESYGYDFGDRLLCAFAARLVGEVREADSVARTGEDEFTLIVGRAETAEDVAAVADRLMTRIRAPLEIEGREVLISASIGVTVFPRDGEAADRLLDNAETALAAAKAQGGNAVSSFSESMVRDRRQRGTLGQELRLALREQRLCLHFQPQIALADGALVGMEALVRWPHPERGLVPAGVFIPVAEEAGIMPELGRWLMGEVCRQNAAWQRAGLARLPISVNVSGRQFRGGDDVARMVEAVLADSGLAAEWLRLEITESIALEDFDAISRVLSRLRQQGVQIHLDDFGTGYSSLSYLLRFPVDALKIDRSFIAGVPASRHGATIVKATLGLARSLGLGVIAEGVEERGQLRFLAAEGCEAVQGYLLGRPAPADEFEQLLARGRVALGELLAETRDAG